MLFSERLRALREHLKKTQNAVAKDIGIATTTYSMYEQGKREPDFEMLCKLAHYYNVSTDYLLGKRDSVKEVRELSEIVLREFEKMSEEDKQFVIRLLQKITQK